MRLLLPPAWILALAVIASAGMAVDGPDEAVVEVFDHETIHWDRDRPAVVEPSGFVARHVGHTVERTVDLPPAPRSHRDDRRIVLVVDVQPIFSVVEGRQVPNDPWNRLGSISIVEPSAGGDDPVETELMRFVTGYGGPGTFEHDVTALAPLLYGRRTVRAYVSSYSDEPGWMISCRLRYTSKGVGQRRPALARRVFAVSRVTSDAQEITAEIEIPAGLDTSRLRILTTGHSTDGQVANEFVTSPHVLKIDGRVVARWRPWSERGGPLRGLNPAAGRTVVDGREVRSSDLDRSGWHPGLVVEPLVIPLPELDAGRHTILLKITGIRRPDPPDEKGKRHHGYWMVSAIVVADEPWPKSK